MHVEIAMLSGVYDIHLLFTIGVLVRRPARPPAALPACLLLDAARRCAQTAVTMLYGMEQERNTADLQGNPGQKSLRSFWYAHASATACAMMTAGG